MIEPKEKAVDSCASVSAMIRASGGGLAEVMVFSRIIDSLHGKTVTLVLNAPSSLLRLIVSQV
jgi:hypothetical protein